jgi:hypothetical protein
MKREFKDSDTARTYYGRGKWFKDNDLDHSKEESKISG